MGKEDVKNIFNAIVLYRNVFISNWFKINAYAEKPNVLKKHIVAFGNNSEFKSLLDVEYFEMLQSFILFLESLHAFYDILNKKFIKNYGKNFKIKSENKYSSICFFLELRNLHHHDSFFDPKYTLYVRGGEVGCAEGVELMLPLEEIRKKFTSEFSKKETGKKKKVCLQKAIDFIEMLEEKEKNEWLEPISFKNVIDILLKEVLDYYLEFINLLR